MNNAEWIVKNKPELFDLFDCPQCSRHDGEKCTRPDELEFDRRECAKGHVAWLMQPHESASECDTTPDCDKDECEPAETENATEKRPETLSDLYGIWADSREKLERDIRGSLGFTTKDVFGWLDRQAAITEHEREQHWMEIVGASANCNLELKRQIDELQERSCPGYEPESHRCKWHDADFELSADRLNDLKRENADLKKRVWVAEETVSARELELREERDYWKGQFRACLGAAAKDGYALGLLEYPKPGNVIEPFLVVTNCIDELRDQLADERRETVTECDRLPENATEIVAKDGKPIRIGETLAGENGIAWTVKGFNRESNYSVIATNSAEETRHLKPEWLTHGFTEQHICDTCGFFVHTGDGTGDCHRYPREVEKASVDWCGEWSE